MKIGKDAQARARSLFRACLTQGRLDEERVRRVVSLLVEKKPRGYLPILHRFRKLVELEIQRGTVTVESAVALPDEAASIFKKAESLHPSILQRQYTLSSDLIGGMRVQIGDDVWDGTIRNRLATLQSSIR